MLKKLSFSCHSSISEFGETITVSSISRNKNPSESIWGQIFRQGLFDAILDFMKSQGKICFGSRVADFSLKHGILMENLESNKEEASSYLHERHAHREDPDLLFFKPCLVFVIIFRSVLKWQY